MMFAQYFYHKISKFCTFHTIFCKKMHKINGHQNIWRWDDLCRNRQRKIADTWPRFP
jgi:hypothetical protein